MEVFDGIELQDVGSRFPFFLPKEAPIGTTASFGVDVARVLLKNSQRKGLFFIMEGSITLSNFHGRDVGQMCSWVQKMTGEPEAALRSVLGFTMAAMGVDQRDLATYNQIKAMLPSAKKGGRDLSARIAGPQNPLMGEHLTVIVEMILTKTRGTPFTRHDFFPIPKDFGVVVNRCLAATPAGFPEASRETPRAMGAPPGYGPPGQPPAGYGAPPAYAPAYTPPQAPPGVAYGAPPPNYAPSAPAPYGTAPAAYGGPPPQAAPAYGQPPGAGMPKFSAAHGRYLQPGEPGYDQA